MVADDEVVVAQHKVGVGDGQQGIGCVDLGGVVEVDVSDGAPGVVDVLDDGLPQPSGGRLGDDNQLGEGGGEGEGHEEVEGRGGVRGQGSKDVELSEQLQARSG